MERDRDDRLFERRLGRGQFLKLGALAAGTGILAACGGDEVAEAPPAEAPPAEAPPAEAPPAEAPPAETPPAETATRPAIDEEPGDLTVFEWAGYEYPTYGGEGGPLQPYVDKYGEPKFTFLTSDDQALGKVRAGFKPDVIHPCIGYVKDWVEMGAIQPWDTSLLPSFSQLNPAIVEASQYDGKQYFMPADWGFSAPMYRADKVEPQGEPSWSIMYDDRYEGKISWWDSPLENFVIWGYVNGVPDPWNMTDEELATAKEFLISKKHLVRNFWSSQTDMDTDFQAGNIWITYAWGGSYTAAKTAGLDVVYPDPVEGRLSWVCGLVLGAETENYFHAHEFAEAWISAASAAWIIPNYAYGHTNTTVDLSQVDPDLVSVFHLDDPTATEEPKAHIDRWVERRQTYAAAWDEVKAA
jgi:spermidine/putrescine-binding protein